MKYLIMLNDPPYGTERSYNALRLAMSLSKREGSELRVFLMADSVGCGKKGQKTPSGYYNLERMIKSLVLSEIPVGVCGSCADARGIAESDLLEGVHRLNGRTYRLDNLGGQNHCFLNSNWTHLANG